MLTVAPESAMFDENVRSLPLHAVFQPIVALASGDVLGYEALIRGPAGSAHATPDALFRMAQAAGTTVALETAAAHTALSSWAALHLPGKLFLNFSPLTLRHLLDRQGQGMAALLGLNGAPDARAAIAPSRVVIEVTEQTAVGDATSFARAMGVLTELGLQYALDDFGTGHANLDRLAELTPEFVKIDKSLVRGIGASSRRLEVLRAVLRMMHGLGGGVIAEGIEDAEELALVRDLGVMAGQGYFLGRPALSPPLEPSPQVRAVLDSSQIAVFPQTLRTGRSGITAGQLLRPAPAVSAHTSNNEVLARFHAHPDLHAMAVIDDSGRPLALINRQSLIDRYATPFHRELYGRKACIALANPAPLCFDRRVTLDDMASLFAGEHSRALADGFVITDADRYVGLGTGADLLRAITEVRMEAARYANPLTFLPGNILLNQHIDRLIEAGSPFHACYVDLNHFKPFNDRYGYWKGDELLKGAAAILAQACDAARDFLGHVGGDDFLVLYQGLDWRERIEDAMARFNDGALAMYAAADRVAGGIHGEDRFGRPVFHPPVTMAVGVVRVGAEAMATLRLGSQHIGAAAAVAKRRAKRLAHGLVIVDMAELAAQGELDV
ncbi:EAL domain-containing protein [Cupriavidus pauculus]|uniref:EAL domain-containing protein n=1 Tax=Cupriavidus pauculus TaxID=82633 RepID=UPI001246A33F|nr:EAL domain-containing protein [Cupriavidus pauculus]KAB0602756.1 EAL domain-containing protein [Cupriavidus pauculus]MCM3606259.1 EAL domain-containing protein [Cupriavidus pauculus]UAL02800.1 EAL domain-containing protein [Cupriavidus pauculus]